MSRFSASLLFIVCASCVFACKAEVVNGGTGAGGTGATGAGAGSTAGVGGIAGGGSGNGGFGGGCGGGESTPSECGPSTPCPQGQLCFSGDPCGDGAACQPLPSPCVSNPTCDCVDMYLDTAVPDCSGTAATGLYAWDDGGDSPCCP